MWGQNSAFIWTLSNPDAENTSQTTLICRLMKQRSKAFMTSSQPTTRQHTTCITKTPHVINSPSPNSKKNWKGIAAATEMFHQHLLKTFPSLCCNLCHVFGSLSRISASQTFPLVLSTLFFYSLCQSLVDLNTGRGSKLAEQENVHEPAKTIAFTQPGSEGMWRQNEPLQIQKHRKNACLKMNLQQPCPELKICLGTMTECDEAKLAGSHAWIVALGSEALLRTVVAEEPAFSFMSRSFGSLQHLHLERGTRRCRGRRWKTKEKMGWSQQGAPQMHFFRVHGWKMSWDDGRKFFFSPVAVRNNCFFSHFLSRLHWFGVLGEAF